MRSNSLLIRHGQKLMRQPRRWILSQRRNQKLWLLKWPKTARIRRFSIVAAAAAVLILVVATKFLLNTDTEIPYKTFASVDRAQDYAFTKMFPIAEELLIRAGSVDFENAVYARAGERFDGEANVLVQDVLGDEMQKKHWRTTMASFRNIEGKNYYPQIFIPDYEDYQTKDKEPVVVFYFSDTEGPNGYEYMSYHIVDGKLAPNGLINEARLQDERVWVMSINENVDDFGDLPADLGTGQTVSSGNGNGGRLAKMAIYDHKESWAGGSSEINVRVYLESWDGLDHNDEIADYKASRSTDNPRGYRVRNFSRQEIAEKLTVDVNYMLHDDWGDDEFLNDGVQMVFVIFEDDVWPNVSNKCSHQLTNGDLRLYSYRGAQDPYDVRGVFRTTSPEGWKQRIIPQRCSG